MTTRSERPTLVVVVGATGSGKTDLSIRLGEHYSSPIVSTDSRQIYKGMPIGTAQPTAEQLSRVEHHFIAERLPQQDFNCGEYETETLRRLETLFERHPLVVAAGGSGLYIQALCDGMDDLPTADKELRRKLKERLDTEGIEALADELYRLDPQCHATVDRCNPARVMRALEVCLSSGRQYSQLRTGRRRERPFRTIKIGTDIERAELYRRIDLRVDRMVADGLEDEVRSLLPLRDCNALQTVGYREIFDYIDHKTSFDEAVEAIKRNTRRYAKRQMTWFRRDPEIAWFTPEKVEEIIAYIDAKVLQN